MIHSPDSLRQAAILFASLDAISAEQLLDRFAPDEADTIRQAAAQLGRVSPTERARAIRAFTQAAPRPIPQPAPAIDGGVEIDGSLAARISALVDCEESTADRTFDFLKDADTDTLVGMLQNEHPQTIAVVLASLPTECAADLLVRLPKSLHINILHRLSELEPGDPESVEAVASELRAWVETWRQQKQKQERGLAAVQGILAAVGVENRDRLVDRIQLQDAALASRLGIQLQKQTTPSDRYYDPNSAESPTARPNSQPANKQPLASKAPPSYPDQPNKKQSLNWDNLLDLDDPTWTHLLRAAEPELTTLALTGADTSLIDRIIRQLNGTDASRFRHALEFPGPTRLSDVATARRELIQIANQILSHST